TGKRLRALEGHRSRVLAVAFSPDSKTLASGDNERNVCLWETGTGRRLHHLEHEGEVGGLTFSPTSKVLAAASNGSTAHALRLWDVGSGALLHRIPRGYCDTSSVVFSPDGRTLCVPSGEEGLRLLAVLSGHDPTP